MRKNVAGLDYSGWTDEQIARRDAMRAEQKAFKAFKAACAAHPLAGALDGLTDASRAVSEAKRFKLVSRDFGNGHRECTVMAEIPSLERTLERSIERDAASLTPRGEGDRERSIEAACRRAKQEVRHKCKAMMVNALWTLTYRANVTDRELVLKHLDAFRRRVVAVLGEWRYIAVLERQERGAWHVHIATHALPVRMVAEPRNPHVVGVKVKSWDVMRAIWRRITGELGGNFDESKRASRWSGRAKPIKGAGSIARYIAGYVAKDMQQSELNRKRYSASKGIEVPEAYRALFFDAPMRELIELAYAAVGDRITRSWYDKQREVFFVESDDTGPPGR